MDYEENTEVILHLPEDIHKLCRTCLSVSNNKMNLSHDILIYNEFNTLTEAAKMLQSCSTIKISPYDGLPMSICDDCATKLEMAYNFKHQCEKSDASLRKILDMPIQEYIDNKNILKTSENEKSDSKLSVVLYENNLYEEKYNPEIGEQIDLSILIGQRHLLNRYMSIPKQLDIEEQINKLCTVDKDDIFSLINERKQYTESEIPIEVKVDLPEFVPVNMIDECKEYICPMCGVIYGDKLTCETHTLNCSKKIYTENDDTSETHTLNCSKKIYTENDDSGENYPPYECHVCTKTFKTKYAKKLHMSSHEPFENKTRTDTYLACDICEKTFPNESKLAVHFQNHAKTFISELDKSNNNLSCSLCAEIFTKEQDLLNHERTIHKKIREIICEICNKEFINEANLITHLKKHGIYVAFCKICLKRFDTVQKLRLHMKTHTIGKQKTIFNCPICKKQFGNIDLLKTHSLEHLNESHKCEICKRTFNNIITYQVHEKQHMEPKFLCSICGKQYFNKVTLRCHVRTHNNEKPFKCPICNKAFSSRATLSVHKRIHSSFKPYVCSYCGYSCRQSGDLAMHIRTHTGDKPYKCTFPDCERKFTTSSQRKEHYRRHTNERNHKCKECGKAFLESKTLKVHMLTHTGEKPHCCDICGRKFRRTHHLANHIKMHNDYVVKLDDIQIDEKIIDEKQIITT